jgi:uncharacterized protein (DUF1778 family)
MMMSVQENIKNNDKDSDVRTKNDRLYIRINSAFKEVLQKRADQMDKSLSTYILECVRTTKLSENLDQNDNVRTTDQEYKKGFEIMVNLFNSAMKESEIKSKIRDLLSDREGKPSEDYKTMIKLIKMLKEGK